MRDHVQDHVRDPEPHHAVEAPARSLMQAVRRQAARDPHKTAIIFLADGENESARVSFGALDERGRALAACLQARGAAGAPVLLPLPSGIHYAVGLLGCVYAGAVPVPIFPPGHSAHAMRIERIAADCGARWALAEAHTLPRLAARFGRYGATAAGWIAVDEHEGDAQHWHAPDLGPEDLAFLQYTSGSTGDPRGVVLRHRHLLHQFRQMRRGLAQHSGDVFVSWLPLFHDMGLIAQLLQPLMLGATLVLMPPAAFLQRPLRWLEALSRHRGTIAHAPNFAFDLCCAAAEAAPPAALDLSAWRVAVNAAEPVHAATLQRFARCFGGAGLRPETLAAGYGLAEATLQLSISPAAGQAVVAPLPASAAALAAGQVRAAGPGEAFKALVPAGAPLPGDELAIVDPLSMERCAEGVVGEIWARGPSVASGYWKRPADTARSFGARLDPDGGTPADGTASWLRTGDLGAWHLGQLYVVGRLKDLIIVRGQNHHPSDLERSVQEAHAALGRAAAFAVDVDGEERVVVMADVCRGERRGFDAQAVLDAVRGALFDGHGLALHALWLLRPGGLPLTSSGKLRRGECRRLFTERGIEPLFAWQSQPASAPPPAKAEAEAGAAGAADAAAEPEDLAALLQAEPAQALQRLLALLFDCTAQALKWDGARRAELRPHFGPLQLNMAGLDSLSAVELSNLLRHRLRLEVPLEDLLAGTTAQQVAQRLHLQLAVQRLAAAEAPIDGCEESEAWLV